MRMPFFKPGIYYTKTGEWAEQRGDYVRVGIDDYSQSALGDIVFFDLPEPGVIVEAGKPFGSLEATKAVSDINAPVPGRVVRVNIAVADHPSIVNSDPFGEGWLVEIEPSDPAELDKLMDSESYKAYLRDGTRQ